MWDLKIVLFTRVLVNILCHCIKLMTQNSHMFTVEYKSENIYGASLIKLFCYWDDYNHNPSLKSCHFSNEKQLCIPLTLSGSVLLLSSFSPAQFDFKGWLKQPAPLTPSSLQVKGRPVQDVCLCNGQAPTNLVFANKLHLCCSALHM